MCFSSPNLGSRLLSASAQQQAYEIEQRLTYEAHVKPYLIRDGEKRYGNLFAGLTDDLRPIVWGVTHIPAVGKNNPTL